MQQVEELGNNASYVGCTRAKHGLDTGDVALHDVGSHSFDYGKIGQPQRALGIAVADQCAAHVLTNVVCELLAQGGLADAGLAWHDDQRGMPRRGRVEGRLQLRKLRFAPDKQLTSRSLHGAAIIVPCVLCGGAARPMSGTSRSGALPCRSPPDARYLISDSRDGGGLLQYLLWRHTSYPLSETPRGCARRHPGGDAFRLGANHILRKR